MQVGTNTSTALSFAMAKKALSGAREQDQQALALIQDATSPSNTANAPRKTSGLNLVA